MKKLGVTSFILAFVLLASCQKEIGEAIALLSADKEEQFSAGRGTVFNEGPNAFGFQIEDLNSQEELQFFTGNSFFNQNWVQAPASTTARDGLGPLFNARSCSGCHFKDGRGRPPLFTGEESSGLLFRLTKNIQNLNGENIGDVHYGGQLQDRGVNDVAKEGEMEISFQTISIALSDGSSVELQKPIYQLSNLNYGTLESDVVISPRVANQIIGLGFLEAISEQTILAFADELDMNGDGISGKPNYVWNYETQQTDLGRFGWKANQPNIKQQTSAAFNGDMGITTSIFPYQNCSSTQTDCQNAPDGGSPEIDDDDLDKVVLYVASTAVPARRNWEEQEVLKGKQLFNQIGCTNCHIPEITTGNSSEIEAFNNQTIRPYTDMLLHDMGADLADGVSDFKASEQEWRTPPLWGIGLFETVNEHTRYLHDGRARNLLEAILWHGGEAETTKQKVIDLSAGERSQLIKFLESL